MFKLRDISEENFNDFLYRVMSALSMRVRNIVGRSKINKIGHEILEEANLDIVIVENDKDARDALRYEFGNGKEDEVWSSFYIGQFSGQNSHDKNLARAIDIVNNDIENPLIKLLLKKLRDHGETRFVNGIKRSYKNR